MTSLVWVSLFTNQTLQRSDFITNFRSKVGEDVEDLITDIQIKAEIPTGLRDINKRTGLLPEFCECTLDGSTYYTLPTGFTNVKQVCYISGSEELPITKTNYQDGNGYYRLGNRLYIRGSQFTGTLRVYGARIPSYPTQDTDYIDLPDDFLDLLTLYMTLFYWQRVRMDKEIQDAYNIYKAACEEAERKVIADYGMGVKMYGKKTS